MGVSRGRDTREKGDEETNGVMKEREMRCGRVARYHRNGSRLGERWTWRWIEGSVKGEKEVK